MTRNFVPRRDNEGSLGTYELNWKSVHAKSGNFDELKSNTIDAIERLLYDLRNEYNGTVSFLNDKANELSSLSTHLEEINNNILLNKADIDSPILVGTPQAPTQQPNMDDNTIATTAYVDKLVYKQKTYYVSPTGSDSNDGSENYPFQTIQRAVNQCSTLVTSSNFFRKDNAGEKIFVEEGTYDGFTIARKSVIIESNGIITLTSPILLIDGASVYADCSFYIDILNTYDAAINIDGSKMNVVGSLDINTKFEGINVDNCGMLTHNGNLYITTTSNALIANNHSVIVSNNSADISSDTNVGVHIDNASVWIGNSDVTISAYNTALLIEKCSSVFFNKNLRLTSYSGNGLGVFYSSTISTKSSSKINSKIYSSGTDYNILIDSSKAYLARMTVTNAHIFGVYLRHGSILSYDTAEFNDVPDTMRAINGSLIITQLDGDINGKVDSINRELRNEISALNVKVDNMSGFDSTLLDALRSDMETTDTSLSDRITALETLINDYINNNNNNNGGNTEPPPVVEPDPDPPPVDPPVTEPTEEEKRQALIATGAVAGERLIFNDGANISNIFVGDDASLTNTMEIDKDSVMFVSGNSIYVDTNDNPIILNVDKLIFSNNAELYIQ